MHGGGPKVVAGTPLKPGEYFAKDKIHISWLSAYWLDFGFRVFQKWQYKNWACFYKIDSVAFKLYSEENIIWREWLVFMAFKKVDPILTPQKIDYESKSSKINKKINKKVWILAWNSIPWLSWKSWAEGNLWSKKTVSICLWPRAWASVLVFHSASLK